MVEITNEIENKYGISMGCLNFNTCTDDEQESMTINQDKINELGSKIDMTYYGFNRENVRGIEFTNIKPNGVGIDVSLNNTNDVLLYFTVTKEKIDVSLNDNSNIMFLSDVETRDVYDIKIYSEKEIMFPENSSCMFVNLVNLDNLFLNNINTSMVTNMSGMFYNTGERSEVFTLDLGEKFDTSKVTNMSEMFSYTGSSSSVFTLDLGDKFDTSNVTNMPNMFSYTGRDSEVFTLDLGDKFDTSKVTDMQFMFFSTGSSDPNFTLDLGDKFDTSNVTNMSYMFYSTGVSSEVFTLDLGDKFDTSNVTDMSYMFYSTGYSNPKFILDLSTFDTSNVTNMSYMFNSTGRSNPNFTLDLSGFDTSLVEDMSNMFYMINNLKTIYVSDKWNTNAVTESTKMFYKCTSLPNFNSNVVDKTNAHYGTGGYLTLKQ